MQLVRAAQKEQKTEQPKKNYKKLFQFLKALAKSQQDML
jgi:ribosomal 50S subunit-associated protein YjgA (DUF615 family)